MKNEAVFARVPEGIEVYSNDKLALTITFDEAAPLKNKPVAESLQIFLQKAQNVAEALQREAALIAGA